MGQIMTKPPVPPDTTAPDVPGAAKAEKRKNAREAHLAQALRDNLRRRKAQAQARAGKAADVSPASGDAED